MQKAMQLLALQKQAMTADSLDALGFIMVNQTFTLVPYDHAIFWVGKPSSPSLKTVSGNLELEKNSDTTQRIKTIIRHHAKDLNKTSQPEILSLAVEDLPKDMREMLDNDDIKALSFLVFQTQQEGVMGGLWMAHNKPVSEAEKVVLQELQESYSTAFSLQHLRAAKSFANTVILSSKKKMMIAAVIAAIALFPVRLSVTAPAEIISKNPGLVVGQFNGILEQVMVQPGEEVKEGTLLAVMERQSLETKRNAALGELDVSRAKLSQLRREALKNPEKKAEIEQVKADIAAKEIEYDFAQYQLQRTEIRAPRDGVAIFSDVSSLEGRPITTGEQIMQIANPADTQLLARIPSDALVPIRKDVPLSFYLNVNPLVGYEGQISSIGYQSSLDPDGLLTYKVRAQIPQARNMRIGWKGTAKLYGDWTILSYTIMRRPIAALREFIGL